MKKKTAYQKALEETEGSGGNGNTSGTTTRPKSREKRVTGEGKPITIGRKTASTHPGWDEYAKKTGTSPAQGQKTETINRPKSREKKITGTGNPIKAEKLPKQTIHGGYNDRPGTKKTKKTKKGSGRKF